MRASVDALTDMPTGGDDERAVRSCYFCFRRFFLYRKRVTDVIFVTIMGIRIYLVSLTFPVSFFSFPSYISFSLYFELLFTLLLFVCLVFPFHLHLYSVSQSDSQSVTHLFHQYRSFTSPATLYPRSIVHLLPSLHYPSPS